ncbi:MAG: hypothetical protein JJT94_14615 [Bernardetiaceae bacterium]|nr:hypothetical protein [Bernardetiaceae bacterium]
MRNINQFGGTNVAVGENKGTINVSIENKDVPKILSPSCPFIPPVFIGRDEEMTTVREKFVQGQNFLMLINGQGGIGKTTFAAKYWERYQNEYNHLAYLNVDNGISDALLSLQDELGIKFPETMPTEKRLDFLIKHVGGLSKPCLLILDNANNEQDLEQNIVFLRSCSNFHILLTSRITDLGEYAEKHPLGTLSKTHGLALFKRHYELMREEEVELFYEIFESVGGNTLVIELMAKNLKNFNNKLRTKYTLKNLKEDLEKGLTELSQTQPINTPYQAIGKELRQETPGAIIMAMYDLTELNEPEKSLLSIFAMLPAENIDFEILENFTDADIVDTLLDLERKGWIEYNKEENSFKTNPIVQNITRYQNREQIFKDCEVMIDFLGDFLSKNLEGSIRSHSAVQAKLYAQYTENFIKSSSSIITFDNNSEIQEKVFMAIVRIAYYYCYQVGDLSKSLFFTDYGYNLIKKQQDSSRDSSMEDHRLKTFLSGLTSMKATISLKMGKNDEAISLYSDMKKVLTEVVKSKPDVNTLYLLQISSSEIATTYLNQGKPRKALEMFLPLHENFRKLQPIFEQSVSGQINFSVLSYYTGRAYSAIGNHKEAIKSYKSSCNILKSSLLNNPENTELKKGLVYCYEILGKEYYKINRKQKALSFYKKQQNLAKELSNLRPENFEYATLLMNSCRLIGMFQAENNKRESALKSFLKAKEGYEKLRKIAPQEVDVRDSLITTYSGLRECYTQQDDVENAIQFCKLEYGLIKAKNSLTIANRKWIIKLYEYLGETYDKQKKYEDSLSYYIKVAEELEIVKAELEKESNSEEGKIVKTEADKMLNSTDVIVNIQIVEKKSQEELNSTENKTVKTKTDETLDSIESKITRTESEKKYNPVKSKAVKTESKKEFAIFEAKSNLLNTYILLGNMALDKLNNVNESHDFYKKGFKTIKNICNCLPGKEHAQSKFNMGKFLFYTGHHIMKYPNSSNIAIMFFKEMKNVFEELHQMFPEDGGIRINISVAHEYIGRSYREQDDQEKTSQHFNKCHEISLALYKEEPDDSAYLCRIGKSYNNLANTYLSDNEDTAEAVKYLELYNKYLIIAHQQDDNLDYQEACAHSYLRLGMLEQVRENYREARKHYLKALPLYRDLQDKDKDNEFEVTDIIEDIEQRIKSLTSSGD